MRTLRALRTRIDRYADEIDSRNRRNFVLFSSGAMPLAGIIFAVSLFFPQYRQLAVLHGFLFLYCCVLFFLSRFCQQNSVPHIRLILYLALMPLLLGAISLGTWLDPAKPAVSIMLFLCILPLFLIDHPLRIVLYQLCFAALFVLFSFLFKPAAVFAADMLYLPIYLSFGIGANLFSLIDRVESAENFVRIQQESQHDALTNLLNRRCGAERTKALLQAQVHGALAILDVDDFKQFNDRCGHHTGDEVLCAVAHAVQTVFRSGDVVWRMGGDEFAVFAVNLLDADTCRRRFAALMETLSHTQVAGAGTLPVSISVGCTLCTAQRPDFEELCKTSDAALYAAKKAGKGRVIVSGAPET